MKSMKRATVLVSVLCIFFLLCLFLQSNKLKGFFGKKKVLYLKPVDYRTNLDEVDDFTFDGEKNFVLEKDDDLFVDKKSDKKGTKGTKGTKTKKSIEIQEEVDESEESTLEDDEEVVYYSHNDSIVVPRLVRGREYASNDFITLITQFTPERAKVFKMICEAWDGSISAVVGVKDKEDQPGVPSWRVDTFLKKFPNRKNIKIISYNITNLDMTKYPINYLRNIAWDAATTPYMFLLDVDFVPSLNTHKYLMNSMILNYYLQATDPSSLPTDKLAFVVPAFEAKIPISSINDKDHALTLLKKEMIFIWGAKHHQASNYPRWKTAKTDYCQEPATVDEYEPYIVVPWYAPQYDPRFLGYSKNKKSQILELILAGYSFVISHNTLITHMPHRRSKHYQLAGRDDNAQNWEDFIRERNQMYPDMIARCDKIDWKNLISSKHIPYPVAPPKPVVEEKKKESKESSKDQFIFQENEKDTLKDKISPNEKKKMKAEIAKNVEDEIETIKMKAEQLEKLAEEEEEGYDEYEEDPTNETGDDVDEEDEVEDEDEDQN